MKAYVGQTRSQTLIAELGAAGIGECTARGELPPRRRPWFYDNGAFRDWTAGKPFDRARFEVDLARIRAEALAPDFVVVPDLVAKGRASLDESLAWLEPLADVAPLYLAVQDGMAERDVAPHVARFAGIFVGGSLRWKMATGGAWVAFAHTSGRPCHVGRVGTADRVAWAREIGVDSIDSSLPLWCRAQMERFLVELRRPLSGRFAQRRLFA